jgi:N-acyl amino acid synthase of PEP-CTERM/exosortase system
MYRYSREHGIHHWYAAMERPLIRILSRLGVVFTRIGPEQDYYGPVVPCTIMLDTLEQQLEADNPALINWFRLDS